MVTCVCWVPFLAYILCLSFTAWEEDQYPVMSLVHVVVTWTFLRSSESLHSLFPFSLISVSAPLLCWCICSRWCMLLLLQCKSNRCKTERVEIQSHKNKSTADVALAHVSSVLWWIIFFLFIVQVHKSFKGHYSLLISLAVKEYGFWIITSFMVVSRFQG